jgi:hypothetical protein
MSLYNIVGSASLQGGQPEDVSQVLANFQAIQTILNGGIDDANVRSTAAITPTKLANYPWKNSDIDPAAAIVLSKLAGYPADATKFARGDGVWALPGIYRKVTPKAVVNSIAETDLLNGEITIPAGLMGISGGIRLTMMGDCVNNSAATQAAPVFKLKLGATTILATAATAAMWAASATRISRG